MHFAKTKGPNLLSTNEKSYLKEENNRKIKYWRSKPSLYFFQAKEQIWCQVEKSERQ